MSTRGLPHPFPLVSPSSLSSALSRAVRLLQDSAALLTLVPHTPDNPTHKETQILRRTHHTPEARREEG